MTALAATQSGAVTLFVRADSNGSLNQAESKTGGIAQEALKGLNNGGSESSLSGRVAQSTSQRTWPQFGQLIASYVTLGLVSAPTLRSSVSSVEIQEIALSNVEEVPLPTDDKKAPTGEETPPAPTFIARALNAIRSFFTGVLNFLFGARNS